MWPWPCCHYVIWLKHNHVLFSIECVLTLTLTRFRVDLYFGKMDLGEDGDLGNIWAILSPSRVQKELFSGLLGNPGSAKKAWKWVKLHNTDGVDPYGVFGGVLDYPRLPQGLLMIFSQWMIRFWTPWEPMFDRALGVLNIFGTIQLPLFIL